MVKICLISINVYFLPVKLSLMVSLIFCPMDPGRDPGRDCSRLVTRDPGTRDPEPPDPGKSREPPDPGKSWEPPDSGKSREPEELPKLLSGEMSLSVPFVFLTSTTGPSITTLSSVALLSCWQCVLCISGEMMKVIYKACSGARAQARAQAGDHILGHMPVYVPS